jgi:Flp pilus assembly pilin Flp
MGNSNRPARRLRAQAAARLVAVRKFLQEEQGASMVEYAFLVGLILLLCLAGVVALSDAIGTVFSNITTTISSNTGS